jgi:hypothetical protein
VSTVAVCTLTSRALIPVLTRVPQAGVVGTLMTCNLGIEELVHGLLHRPAITSLVVCGRDSPRFRSGQSLVSLFRHGLDVDTRQIIGARGYLPVLRSVRPTDVDALRERVRLVDVRGLEDPDVLRQVVIRAANRGRRPAPGSAVAAPVDATGPGFQQLSPGGRREGLHERNEGFVVVTTDECARRIRLRSYGPDLSPRHEMTGRRAESMLLGLLRAGVVREPSHAGYLGGELVKAETALRLGLRYEQDLPLRATGPREGGQEGGDAVSTPTGVPTLAQLTGQVRQTLGLADDTPLNPGIALGEQLLIESARMIELAIVLEEDLGVPLPDDVDLRRESIVGLHERMLG